MAADGPRHRTVMGVEVRDGALYARYRAAMRPLLESEGGRFEHDFEVARVLASSASPRINRVFVLSFPDEAARGRFFADPRYQRIRAELFEPAVANAEVLVTSFAASVDPTRTGGPGRIDLGLSGPPRPAR